MAQADLTPRQKEIKSLLTKGNDANAIAKKLGITTNAVYQQIRRIRAGGGTASTGSSRSRANANGGSKAKAAKSGRKSAGSTSRSRTRTAPRPAPKPVTPATAEELLRSEVQAASEAKTEASATIDSLKGQIAEQELRIAALDAEIATKGDVLAVLTGEKVAHAKPAPAKPKPARKRGGSSSAKATGQQSTPPTPPEADSGSQGAAQAPSNGSAAETPQPSSQAEREATADHDGGETAPAADEAAATA